MPIYDMFDTKENMPRNLSSEPPIEEELLRTPPCFSSHAVRDRFFSSLASRLFFLLLLLADLVWAVYALAFFIAIGGVSLLTFFKLSWFSRASSKGWISVKRSLICALSLFVALFSPAFGIMVACTYFLMYDKTAIEEIVPASLQDQFKEFFKSADS